MIATPLIVRLVVLLSFSVVLSACSVYMAAKQPERKDLSVLGEGTPQPMVRAEFGTPVWTGKENGLDVDVFAFTQGYSKGARAARAIWHGVADVFTAGLWELVGTPTELIASGTKMKLTVIYDPDLKVKMVRLHDDKGNEVPLNTDYLRKSIEQEKADSSKPLGQ